LDHSDLCLLGSQSKDNSPGFASDEKQKVDGNILKNTNLNMQPVVPMIDRSKD